MPGSKDPGISLWGPIIVAVLLELLVAAAASTRPALEVLRPAMESACGERVVIRYGGTGAFARQIENGAPFDVFFAADEMTPRLLGAKGLLDPHSLRLYAEGSLVLVTAQGSPVSLPARVDAVWLSGLPVLAFGKLAIGSPKVSPYGRAAKEALTRVGAWNALFPRIVTAGSVEEVLAYVSSGNADLGFCAASLARGPGLHASPVDANLHGRLFHMAGVVRASRRPSSALRCLDAATARPTRAAWESAGFLPLGP